MKFSLSHDLLAFCVIYTRNLFIYFFFHSFILLEMAFITSHESIDLFSALCFVYMSLSNKPRVTIKLLFSHFIQICCVVTQIHVDIFILLLKKEHIISLALREESVWMKEIKSGKQIEPIFVIGEKCAGGVK